MKFEEGSGYRTYDSSGTTTQPCSIYVNQGVNPWIDTGYSGKALKFDGLTYVKGSIEHVDTLSVIAYVKLDTLKIMRVVGKGSFFYNGAEEWNLFITDSGKVGLNIRHACTGIYNTTLYSSAQLSTDEWYCIAGIYDGDSIKIFVNGILSGSTNVNPSYAGPIADCGGLFRIGCWWDLDSLGLDSLQIDSLHFDFEGMIDEVRIYNRALSASEIYSLYSPDTLWSKTYQSSNGVELTFRFLSAFQLTDSSFITVGDKYNTSTLNRDGFIVKTNSSGDTLWTKVIGGSGAEVLTDVIQLQSENIICSGYTSSFGSGSYDGWIICLDSDGDTLWTKTFGSTGDDRFLSLSSTTDSGFICCGSKANNSWLMRFNKYGDNLWQKVYANYEVDYLQSAVQTMTGNFIGAGLIWESGKQYQGYIVYTDPNGDTIWTKKYGGAQDEFIYSCIEVNNNNFIFGGKSNSIGAGNDDGWVISTDSSGTLLWEKTYGGTGYDFIQSLKTYNNGILFCGQTTSGSAGSYDGWIYKIDSDGHHLWEKKIGTSTSQSLMKAIITKEKQPVFAGNNNGDAWLVRLESE
jgi:hypothetical protein